MCIIRYKNYIKVTVSIKYKKNQKISPLQTCRSCVWALWGHSVWLDQKYVDNILGKSLTNRHLNSDRKYIFLNTQAFNFYNSIENQGVCLLLLYFRRGARLPGCHRNIGLLRHGANHQKILNQEGTRK